MGADPKMMADAARFNADNGAQIIDINMGCPAKKVCNVAAGSALLKDEKLVQNILHEVVNSVSIPVTLKIRTGWDRQSKNAVQIAKIAESEGIQALAIHGRTRADAYKGDAEYSSIAEVKNNVSIPVIANGDIKTPQKAKEVLEITKADGLMIGRAAQGNPWIFAAINYYLKHGTEIPEPSLNEVSQTLSEHLENLYEFYGEHTGVLVARKHISWYSKGMSDAAEFRRQVNTVKTPEDQLQIIADFFSKQKSLAA
jgi:tRNA-dihydrouridine synthase B